MKFSIGQKVRSTSGRMKGAAGVVKQVLAHDCYRVQFTGKRFTTFKYGLNLTAFAEPKAKKPAGKKSVYLFNVGDRIIANPNSEYAGQKGTIIAQPMLKGGVYSICFDAGFTGHKLERYMKIAKPKRRVGIFYHSHKPGLGRIPVYMADGLQIPVAYVRVELAPKGTTLASALAKAKPQKGENLMNTHVVVVP